MENYNSILPILVPLSALCAVPFIILFREYKYIKETISIFSAITMFSLVNLIFCEYLSERVLFFELIKITPTISISFRTDNSAILFAMISSFLWIITTFYSIGYLRGLKEKKETSFYVYFALTLFATSALAFSANLITTFIFYELITLFTYPLVTHKGTEEAKKAGRKYLAYLLGTSLFFFLSAIIITYGLTNNLNYSESGVFSNISDKKILLLILLLFIFGVGKSAIMPIHSWLPTAMVAPTPVSALLHAVAVVKAGVFVLYRVLNFIFTQDILISIKGNYILITVASVTIIFSSLIALRQDNLKLRLAYSTISQLSYIILGFSLVNKYALMAGLTHLLMHAFGKITLFFCAGAIYVKTHITEISKLDGIGKKMPITMFAFTLGSLSMIGIPGLGGFISKFYLMQGIAYSGFYPIFIVLAISTLLNCAYFMPIVYSAFFGKNSHIDENHYKTNKKYVSFMEIPLLITALITCALFLSFKYFANLIGG